MLARIGIEVTLQRVDDRRQWINQLFVDWDFDVALLGFASVGGIEGAVSDSGRLAGSWCSVQPGEDERCDRYQKVIDGIGHETVLSELGNLVLEAEQLLADDVAFVPLVHRPGTVLAYRSDLVAGVDPTSSDLAAEYWHRLDR